ncbi:hypothetical protein HTZ84_16200 [Haloterrigena sp. SYSU A558-1]|uniref:Uncharacterized protein n=1 Tax=Haloterrigena gelatinilytica TaxID=2741724 RepID=A0ABX2LC27_9EURY|nr:hypothetical protein [Haloterrigena gelatinilytica]NUC73824.1 hypothetical protein [Haloterrigena gelatinilytica]
MSPPNRPRSTATPSASTDRSRTDRLCSRRTFIAAGSATALASLAGCSAVADFLADMALQEVNVFNGADESVSGTIEVVDPDDETVLEETFDLEASSEDDESDENTEATAQYDDVWTDSGDYEVTVALDDPLEEGTTDDSSDDSGNETNETNESDSTADEELANASVEDGDVEPDAANETDGNETDNETDSDDPSQSGPSKTDTVSIDDTDEQSLVIGIAQDEPADLISYHVIEDFSDLEDEFE